MATLTHHCAKKGGNTTCPACGRVAPDWCAEDEPENLPKLEVILTGHDLAASVQAEEDAKAEVSRLEAEQEEAEAKVFKTRRGRKVEPVEAVVAEAG